MRERSLIYTTDMDIFNDILIKNLNYVGDELIELAIDYLAENSTEELISKIVSRIPEDFLDYILNDLLELEDFLQYCYDNIIYEEHKEDALRLGPVVAHINTVNHYFPEKNNLNIETEVYETGQKFLDEFLEGFRGKYNLTIWSGPDTITLEVTHHDGAYNIELRTPEGENINYQTGWEE